MNFNWILIILQSLEEKYAIQKSVMLKMEEHMLEMSKNSAANPSSPFAEDRIGN